MFYTVEHEVRIVSFVCISIYFNLYTKFKVNSYVRAVSIKEIISQKFIKYVIYINLPETHIFKAFFERPVM